MISYRMTKEYCKDDISKIENYEKAINDNSQIWVCHHRLELTLNNEEALSQKDLKRLNMFYKRPYFELIFLTKKDHDALHNFGFKTKGKKVSLETKKKLSEAHIGKKFKHKDQSNKNYILSKIGSKNPMFGKGRFFDEYGMSLKQLSEKLNLKVSKIRILDKSNPDKLKEIIKVNLGG